MAPVFSRPVNDTDQSESSETAKRQRIISTKLTNADNISKDAKKRTLEQVARGNMPAASASRRPVQANMSTPTTSTVNKSPTVSTKTTTTHPSSPKRTRNGSVEIEEIPDIEMTTRRNAGPTKNPASILEASDGSDDDELPPSVVSKGKKRAAEPQVPEPENEKAPSEEPAAKKLKSETAEEELGE